MSKRDRHRAEEREAEPDAPPAPEAQGDGEPEETETPIAEAVSSAELDVALQQLADQRDKYLRLAAEYDNFRKRSAKERAESGSRAQAELVTKLIDALDDLSRFAHVDPVTTDSQTLHKGIALVEQ